MAKDLLCCVLFFILYCPAFAQFTKITDAANPVVNDQFESGGGSWIDVNGDGFLDLFVANGNLSNQNNSFYLNNTVGGFTKITTGAPVSDGGSSIGSTWGDFDNDGNVDFFVTNRQNFGNFLYKGNGDTVFTKIIAGSIVTDIANSNSSSWVDVDRDGNLDLYVVNFQGNDFFYHNNGAPNFDFTRIDTLLQIGDGANFSISGSWADFNNDRLSDFFVGNAGSQSDYLYRNGGNNVFFRIVLADGKASVGNSWGDYDNDGSLDLFVANTVGQNNILYHNSSFPFYELDPVGVGIVSNDGGNSVGSAWGDYDNDGDIDLFVANDGGNNFLYQNDGPPNYTFTKISSGTMVNDGGNSFGAVWADYDNDGFLDLFVANRLNQKNFLYHNDGNSNHWIEIKCTGSQSNRSAIGTKIRLKATINGTERWQMREIQSQTGYNSENLTAHFGVGDATVIDSIIIEWPSGLDEYYINLSVDQILSLGEAAPPAPVLISAAVGDSFLIVRWKRESIGNFDHYGIFADTVQNPAIEVGTVSSINDTVFTISGLNNYTRYYIRIKTVNTNNVSSMFSNELDGIPLPVTVIQLSVKPKWNIISLPVQPLDSLSSVLFPTALSSAYIFDGGVGYQQADTLQHGIGYWIKFPDNENIAITGFPIETDTIPVSEGWNLIGSITHSMPVQFIVSDPPGIITGNFFGYNGGYYAADTIQPGNGYWVKANQAGLFVLSSSMSAHNVASISILPDPELPPSPPFEISTGGYAIPQVYSLLQNYPNPFNPVTTIHYEIPELSQVTLSIYNMLGEEMALLTNGKQEAGLKSVAWDAKGMSSGMYFYRITAVSAVHPGISFYEVKKMMLLK